MLISYIQNDKLTDILDNNIFLISFEFSKTMFASFHLSPYFLPIILPKTNGFLVRLAPVTKYSELIQLDAS